jgi:hypothetical protein
VAQLRCSSSLAMADAPPPPAREAVQAWCLGRSEFRHPDIIRDHTAHDRPGTDRRETREAARARKNERERLRPTRVPCPWSDRGPGGNNPSHHRESNHSSRTVTQMVTQRLETGTGAQQTAQASRIDARCDGALPVVRRPFASSLLHPSVDCAQHDSDDEKTRLPL